MDHFQGKIAIVTGGASGIGRAVAEELGRRGAVVVVADVNGDGAREVAGVITQAGGQAQAVELDVGRGEEVERVVRDTASAHGRLDLIFNNAGIGIGGDYRDITLEHWRRIMDVNLWGVIYGTHAAYPIMVRQGSGDIVNTASMAGLLPAPMTVPYCTTKHAVVGLSTALRAEAASLGVNVSVVCPGVVQTGIFEAGTILKADRAQVMAQMPPGIVSADYAARIILRGVERKRPVIVFPFAWRVAWWLHRLHPALLRPLANRAAREFRLLRQDT